MKFNVTRGGERLTAEFQLPTDEHEFRGSGSKEGSQKPRAARGVMVWSGLVPARRDEQLVADPLQAAAFLSVTHIEDGRPPPRPSQLEAERRTGGQAGQAPLCVRTTTSTAWGLLGKPRSHRGGGRRTGMCLRSRGRARMQVWIRLSLSLPVLLMLLVI